MKDEIDAAVKFITKLIKQNSKITEMELQTFQQSLRLFLIQKFRNHWHPHKPWQGQGYRCLRLNGNNGKEATIDKAAAASGLKYSDLNLPLELTVWVDPDEVCCRFGEHKGSYCTVASFKGGKRETFIDNIDLNRISGTKENKKSTNSFLEKQENLKKESRVISQEREKKENISPNAYQDLYNKPQGEFRSPEVERDFSFSKTFTFIPKNQQLERVLVGRSDAAPPSPLYYKSSSWVGYPPSISPPLHSSYIPNAFIDYPAVSQFSSQENLNFNRGSPVNVAKYRWNSAFYPTNANQRNAWYMNRHMARV